MRKPSEKLEAIFEAALALETEAQRADYLNRACPDLELRREVDSLLAAHQNPDSVFAEKTARMEVLPSEGVGTVIGRYKLLEKLGEGGFGSVWLSEQKEPVRRKVALKLIKPGMDTQQVVARFEAERQALALMDHPNIAKVLDAGTTNTGRPYFVMELVRGVAITKFCDENKLVNRERLDLFIKVCHAVQHAHQKGIIHRDLKPSNVLVTLHDGVAVPKVIDFGIAKAMQQPLAEKTVFSQFQQFLGTPAYISPEQSAMSGLDIDTRSDIYSLGVLLYELLTGGTPFDPKTLLQAGFDEMRRIIREKEPPRPSTRLSTLNQEALVNLAKLRHVEAPKLIRLLRGDLDWIVMKALEKDRTRRYETANGLAADIERHLKNEPVGARPPSTAYRIQKFVSRNKGTVLAGVVVAAALLLGAVVSLWQAREARAARHDALHHLYIANLNVIQRDYEQGNLQHMKRLLETTQSHPQRGFEWYYWQRRIHQEVQTFRGHTGPLRGIALSPDGRFAATASAADLPGPNCKLWDLATGRELLSFDLPYHGRAVAFSPDSQRLAVGGGGRMFVWDIAARRELFSLTNRFTNFGEPKSPTNAPTWSLAYSPDGQQIAVGLYMAPAILIADANTGQVQAELGDGTTNLFNVASLAFSPDGSKLAASVLADGAVGVWDLATLRLLHRLPVATHQLWQLGFDPTGRRLVTAHFIEGAARVWNLDPGTLEKVLDGHIKPLQCALFSPRGDRIYTAGWDGQVRIWDAVSYQEIGRLPKGHTLGIISMDVSRDGRYIVTGSWDGEAKLWDTTRLDEPPTFRTAFWPDYPRELWRFFGVLRGPYVTLSPASNAGLILALAPTNQVVVWDFATQRELFRIDTGHRGGVSALAVAPDLRRLATGSEDGSVFVWDARDGTKLFALEGHTNKLIAVAFSRDARRIITATADNEGKVRVCDALGRLVRTLAVGREISGISIAPDQPWLALGVNDGWSEIWNFATGRRIHTLPNRTGGTFNFAWSPDGRRVASAGWDKVTRVWEVSSGKLLVECVGHTFPVWCVAFSPDGTRLLTGSMDRTAKVWDATSGRELLTLSGHTEDVHSVAWAGDGRQIVTGSDDQTMKIWEAASVEDVANWEAEEAEAETRLVRSPSPEQTAFVTGGATTAKTPR